MDVNDLIRDLRKAGLDAWDNVPNPESLIREFRGDDAKGFQENQMSHVIEVENIGPVRHSSLRIPEAGGVVIYRGRNGSGKSKLLEAVGTALSGHGKIEVTDGQLSGRLEAFGVLLRVGRSVRRSGEMEVETLEGRLSAADLVDPGIKDGAAADARRIKALVSLAGAQPDPELFVPLLGTRANYDAVVAKRADDSADLLQMADRVKRAIEETARKEESLAEQGYERAKSLVESAAGVDVSQPCDADELHVDLEAAILHRAELIAQRDAAGKLRAARERLAESEGQYAGLRLADAKKAESAISAEADKKAAEVRDLMTRLEASKAEHGQLLRSLRDAAKASSDAEAHERRIAELKRATEGDVEEPSSERLTEAETLVRLAKEAIERGGVVRGAKDAIADGAAYAREAEEHSVQAEFYREAAKGTDEVLTKVVAQSAGQSGLRVEAGRLVLDTARGATYFGDLSAGERWRIALEIATAAVGKGGVITVPQEAWEGLDPGNRAIVARHAAALGVVVLTAEASDDQEIRAEMFDAESH